MENFAGTRISLIIRILQGICAIISLSAMLSSAAAERQQITPFRCLVSAMVIQAIWSLVLVGIDAYWLAKKKIPRNLNLHVMIVLGDWATGWLSLGAASASAAVDVYIYNDLRYQTIPEYHLSIAMAFISWALVKISGLIMTYFVFDGL